MSASARSEGLGSEMTTLADIMRQEPDDLQTVRVLGDFTDRIKIVRSTSATLLLGFGKLDGTEERVMLPFLETKVEATSPVDDEANVERSTFAETLTFENAAYLLVSLAGDMRMACAEIVGLSGGDLKPERGRLQQTRYLLAHAAREAIASTSYLTTLLESFPAEPAKQSTPHASKQRILRKGLRRGGAASVDVRSESSGK